MVFNKKFDVTIIGGLGHVGLPLGITFAHSGLEVCLYDLDKKKAEDVVAGKMPFIEYGAEPILKEVLENRKLHVSSDIESVSDAEYIIVTIGTPIDEYHNPKNKSFFNLFEKIHSYMNPEEQTIIIRSTIYPGTTNRVFDLLKKFNNDSLENKVQWRVSFCPERIVQGYAMKELSQIPQIVSGVTPEAADSAVNLFKKINPDIIKTDVKTAELSKLFANSYRYITFAMANQFYQISQQYGADYNKVREVMMRNYPRAAALPSAGFAAGPCLFKDTMQLVAFDSAGGFSLGREAKDINEGFPAYLLVELNRKYNLSNSKVGILGMAFKADIDDIRESLSFKLAKKLEFDYGSKVFCSDPYVNNTNFVSTEYLLDNSDIAIIGAPHSIYKNINFPDKLHVVDVWGIIKK